MYLFLNIHIYYKKEDKIKPQLLNQIQISLFSFFHIPIVLFQLWNLYQYQKKIFLYRCHNYLFSLNYNVRVCKDYIKKSKT